MVDLKHTMSYPVYYVCICSLWASIDMLQLGPLRKKNQSKWIVHSGYLVVFSFTVCVSAIPLNQYVLNIDNQYDNPVKITPVCSMGVKPSADKNDNTWGLSGINEYEELGNWVEIVQRLFSRCEVKHV